MAARMCLWRSQRRGARPGPAEGWGGGAHVLVEVAAQGDEGGAVEELGRWWRLVGAVATEVEALGWGEREDVVVGGVLVWKLDARAGADGQEAWNKSQVALDD